MATWIFRLIFIWSILKTFALIYHAYYATKSYFFTPIFKIQTRIKYADEYKAMKNIKNWQIRDLKTKQFKSERAARAWSNHRTKLLNKASKKHDKLLKKMQKENYVYPSKVEACVHLRSSFKEGNGFL